ncbi:bis(5'-nucleosyl)-tetraphosphatase (symmetrical) YqeK [Ruminococcus sp.]|uniref:bis(5'-nucleosyl)-tetraphosphatase (symmetrical) YqeK n=1 Tax=Ruminococcus sp. TaxID=41978 RepID=UPI0025F08AC7|nr:bis(5'-nucleosyl)-tetraphosphatase (symmetrical) YqeK [Ruminococcus sp.]MCI5815945.1 bis(5'-nucleosyl)-tetraphosphatase (symmetrical) YqeK [Ruminococcus sp.]MDD7555880.1 bis(5'-nucleosyl)-tetraphosphatase (symmetrical) YqeK [Ruminococcus sp.]MDY4964532.1 bis(5'-nucleosyl)-tetraphosphatase (symmetrical) YqeK [Ruminococcus callidus]
MYHFDENRAFLKARLSKKRYTHSLNVAKEAQRLAELYGEDPEKAYFAGLMHDVCKELPAQEQEELVRASSFAVSKEELATKPVWHGIAGAYFLQVRMGVTDPDVLNAVRYHTVARAGMTRLEEIVYLADLISEDRTYAGVEQMRQLCLTSINAAMLEGVRFSIETTLKKGGYLPPVTVEAYNQYIFCEKQEKHHKTKT